MLQKILVAAAASVLSLLLAACATTNSPPPEGSSADTSHDSEVQLGQHQDLRLLEDGRYQILSIVVSRNNEMMVIEGKAFPQYVEELLQYINDVERQLFNSYSWQPAQSFSLQGQLPLCHVLVWQKNLQTGQALVTRTHQFLKKNYYPVDGLNYIDRIDAGCSKDLRKS